MRTKKSLGQHFLRCRWVVSTLMGAADVSAEDIVLEVGPGTGILTRQLAKTAGRVIAVEKDERLATLLAKSLRENGITNVIVIPGDILETLPSVATHYKLQPTRQRRDSPKAASYKLVANIPYYLTSRLLRLLLEEGPQPNSITLTIQKEVAERIVARPPHMNLLSLSVQAFGRPKIIQRVPAGCFSPKPKVDSAIIHISDISDHFFIKNHVTPEVFFRTIRAAFSQKRKKLRNSLSFLAEEGGLGLAKDARPEEISLEKWAEIVLSLKKGGFRS